ncbi:MAG: hypothetical protein HXX16_18240 [Bacteroidales bacterium]|nr:hypothetical protein [Bacteroidales bacterium]
MSLGILLAIGAQFATSAINYKRSSNHNKKLQLLQQEYEVAIQNEGFERAWDKHEQLCALQKEIEKELHQRRLENIEQSFNRYLDNAAYSQALKNWPLRVLPFVMKDESICCDKANDSNAKIALHCLLTRSNDDNFNKAIFRELEVRLDQSFNQYWGASSTHPILFYSGAWKEKHDASAIIDNLYNQLEQLPTIVISPWIDENNEFYFKISIWGIPHIEMKNIIYKPEGTVYQFKQGQTYSKEAISQILNELSPIIVAFVGYVADRYCWIFYQIPPKLPSLLINGTVSINDYELDSYKKQYLTMFEDYIVKNISNKDDDAKSIIRLNMQIEPERSLELIEEIKKIIPSDKIKDMLDESLKALFKSRKIQETYKTIEELLAADIFTLNDIKFLNLFGLNSNDKIKDICRNSIKRITEVTETNNIKWQIKLQEILSFQEILNWINANMFFAQNATMTAINFRNNNTVMVVFVCDSAKIICNNKLGGVLYIVSKVSVPVGMDVNNDIILWDFKQNKCVTNNFNFMNQEHFYSFRDLGKKVDKLINSLQEVRLRQKNDSKDRIISYFKENQTVFMESERVNCLSLVSIKDWVKSKLPVNGATEMWAIKAKEDNGFIVCLFWANNENAFLENTPQKRIFCSCFSDDLSELFNNNDFFVINKL